MTEPHFEPADPEGVYYGYYYDRAARQWGAPLVSKGDRHVLLFGPSGSGKSAGVLIPNLLSLTNRSIIVLDPKGELAAATAAFRRTVGDVLILNPFDELGLTGCGFNPLAALNPDSKTFVDDATGLAEALVRVEDKDPHWSESAQALITALIMWEVKVAKKYRRLPKLENVRGMLTEADAFEPAAAGKAKGRQTAGLRLTIAHMVEQGGFEIASLAARFFGEHDEIKSIRSTADRQDIVDIVGAERDSLVRNETNFADLKKKPTTVYVILPAERMRTHSVWLRLVIVRALQALYSAGGIPTLFMLDEFAQLGHLGAIEDAVGLVRGYGIQIWPVVQDLNQLKALYKDRWESFVGNAGVVQAFAPNDLTTAEWMSRRTGFKTETALGFNMGDGQSGGGPTSSHGLGYQQVKAPLFLPQELFDFPRWTGVMWTARSSRTIPFVAPHYRSIEHLRKRAGHNPFVQHAPIPAK